LLFATVQQVVGNKEMQIWYDEVTEAGQTEQLQKISGVFLVVIYFNF
jgi:hypothetical protein